MSVMWEKVGVEFIISGFFGMDIPCSQYSELNGVLFHVRHHNLLLSFGRTHGFRPVSGPFATDLQVCHKECLSALVGAVSQ